MTRTLILMRHAKSDWGSASLPDHARPLNARGASDAPLMGEWLRQQRQLPDEVLCSTATRTQETFAGLRLDAAIRPLPSLYHADPDTMLDALQTASGACVLMVGHNPGIAAFAADLVAKAPDHPRFDDYPTSATLVVTFDIPDWAALHYGTGRAVAFAIPADLK
ncbi:MAG: SixA phosphatase family protein [Rhodobacterales bacterium]